jgi:signal transduction histidine kinase
MARERGGLGLGLSIAQSLVALHGGEIAAESAGPGQGSVFRVRLPLAAALPVRQDAPRAEAARVLNPAPVTDS